MDEKDKVLTENIKGLLELKKDNATEIYLKSMKKTFSLKFGRGLFLFIFFLFSLYFLLNIVFSHISAMNFIGNITGDINTIIIPVFAVIITGYAIFQALVNGNTVVRLLTVKHQNKESKFERYNLYFFGLACNYLILIIINFILLFVSKNINPNWTFGCLSRTANEMISATLISLYLSVLLYFLIELKSFIYNLFQVFITSASDISIEHLTNKKNQEKKK